MQKCSDQYFSKFKAPGNEGTAKKVKKFLAEGHFYCIDFSLHDFTLYGTESSGIDHIAIDIILVPCASRVTLYDGSVVGGDDSCVWDKDEVRNYMGQTFSLLAYHN